VTVESGVERSLAAIRSMVLSGQLLPGPKVLQKELADSLGVSRIPVREALAQLHAEGILDHRSNTGFTVGRFDSEDLAEIYLMRRLLETELIKSADLAQVDVALMKRIHKSMAKVDPVREAERYQELNQQFHFAIFEASPLKRVRQEVSRLWYMSGFYRAFLLYLDERAASLHLEHKEMLEAVQAKDAKRLVKVSDEHRNWTEKTVVRRLGRTRV
jgi:DNA-binding GntR family transcriptional regulator